MSIIVTGSVAFDYLMSFPGRFSEHILPEQLHQVSLSFLVDSMRKQRGGCAPNIAYTLALLGEHPTVMATVGQDFAEYRTWLENVGVDTSAIVEIDDEFTASFFVNTDQDNNQIASFYIGAMAQADTLSFHDLDYRAIELAIISPNAPTAMVKYARECVELGVPYIYDPSQQIVRLNGEELLEGTRGARALIVNEYEFGMIKNKTGLSEEELLTLPPITIITQGEGGSTIYVGEQVLSIPVVPPLVSAEPTGVGDAYRGGIIKGMLRGYSWETTGRIAALAATYVLEHHGTQNHRYTPEDFVRRYRQIFGDALELKDLLTDQKTGQLSN
ncbi:MAG TPA: carbohydrate kinase family protein [Anaerolineae bacterium]|nr:carbohydrate kinase family protein [Anaerolineae bacterium]